MARAPRSSSPRGRCDRERRRGRWGRERVGNARRERVGRIRRAREGAQVSPQLASDGKADRYGLQMARLTAVAQKPAVNLRCFFCDLGKRFQDCVRNVGKP